MFAIGQVEQAQVVHPLKTAGQVLIELAENLLCCGHQFIDLLERPQRRAIQRVHRQVPRTQFVQLQLPTPFRLQLAQRRHDFPLNRLMKFQAILRRVVEAASGAKGVLAVIAAAGVLRDLLAQFDELVEHLLEWVGLLQSPVGDEFPRLLSQGAVHLFQVARHLRQRFLLATKLHGQ